MNRTETIQILAVLKAAYPNAFRDIKQQDANAMVNLWAMQFADDSYEDVSAAVMYLISSRTVGYTPTIGEVKERLQQARFPDTLNESEAWSMVRKAISRSTYGSKEEFEKLPPVVQKAVGSPESLREWAMSERFNESVESSNFKRAYRTCVQRESEMAMVPASVRMALENIASRMALETTEKKGIGYEGIN